MTNDTKHKRKYKTENDSDSTVNNLFCKPAIVYLAGPMRGIAEYNFPAFLKAADELRSNNLIVISPAEHELENGLNPKIDMVDEGHIQKAFRWDLIAILTKAEIIIVLPGWRNSIGAQLEVQVAQSIGLPVLDFETRRPIKPEDITIEAHRIVNGSRQKYYGHPRNDFYRTGKLWGTVLADWRLSGSDAVPPNLVGLCMALVKISRECNSHKRDNLVDLAGYAETIQMIEDDE